MAYGQGGVYQPAFKGRDGERRALKIWWIRYPVPGRGEQRESSRSRNKNDAIRLLKQRNGEVGSGTLVAVDVTKTTLGHLWPLVRGDYAAKQRKSVRGLETKIKHLRRYFGDDLPVIKITTPDGNGRTRIDDYREARLKVAQHATINRELSALRRALRLGRERGLVGLVPKITMLSEQNARRGFFEPEEFRAVLRRLPEYLRGVFEVAYITGWRVQSELLTRKWEHVNFRGAGSLRLEPGETKNNEGREFPLMVGLREVFRRQKALAGGSPWVFPQPNGNHWVKKEYYKAWNEACRKTGIARIPHDFRRTAVRNLEKAGVPRTVAMKLVGHKTESIYSRYAIADERMIRAGAQQYQAYLSGLQR